MHSPCIEHSNILIQILWYIKKLLGQRLMYKYEGNLKVVTYSNVDWARSIVGSKFIYGYCVSVGGNFVS